MRFADFLITERRAGGRSSSHVFTGFVQLGLYLLALVVATPVLGAFMARTFQDRPTLLSPTGSLTSASERRCAARGKSGHESRSTKT